MNDDIRICENVLCGRAFVAHGRKRFCSRDCQIHVLHNGNTEMLQSTVPTMSHVFIPDTQVKPGVPTIHLSWAGQYIVDHFRGRPVRVIHAMDHWDMPSLSSYDKKGGKKMEGRRIIADIEAGNRGFELLSKSIEEEERAQPDWDIEKHCTFGNHEDRITRAVENDATVDGLVSLDDLDTRGWQRHDFLDVLWLDGVAYSHYFYNPMTGRPYAGENLKLRLKNIGHSFTMGHQQTYDTAVRFVGGKQQRALVAGAFYLHDEDYKGPQGNAHWRGILVKHDVHDGAYNLMEIDMDYLCRRYEGMRLDKFLAKYEGKTI